MMFRVTNLARARRIIHDSKLVAKILDSDVTIHIALSKEAAISIQRFSKSLRIEPVDEEAASALNVVFTPLGPEQLSMRFNDPAPPSEEVVLEPVPPPSPQEEWGKLDEGTATILKDLAQKAEAVPSPTNAPIGPRTQVRLSKAS
jgi:hypothetical protein